MTGSNQRLLVRDLEAAPTLCFCYCWGSAQLVLTYGWIVRYIASDIGCLYSVCCSSMTNYRVDPTKLQCLCCITIINILEKMPELV